MVSVRDNRLQISMTLPQHFNKNSTFLERKKKKLNDHVTNDQGIKKSCFHSYFIILSLVIMDPVSRLTTCPAVIVVG